MMLRPARAGDAGAIAGIYASYIDDSVSFETQAPDAATMAVRIAAGAPLYPWLVAEAETNEGSAVLGYAYAGPFSPRDAYRWAPETTIYLARDSVGRGVGRRLYDALLATLTAQGFARAIGRIALPNDPSLALHRALGFAQAGLLPAIGWKAGRWIDVAIWQRALATTDAPPREPRPFGEVGLIDP
jgi:phosphinothricin acetyltransferase